MTESEKRMMVKLGLKKEDFEPKKPNKTDDTPRITDELGNVYTQYIGTDGQIHLKLIEAYNGELFE